jgi:hypothetical protein
MEHTPFGADDRVVKMFVGAFKKANVVWYRPVRGDALSGSACSAVLLAASSSVLHRP